MEPMATLRSERESTKDGGLILMKGSSKLFDELFAKKREQDEHEDKPPPEEETRDLFIFKEEDVKWFESRGYTLQKINIGPGDLGDLIRHVQYVCMTPPKFAKEQDIKLKSELFHDSQGTTHWPHYNIHKAGPPLRNGKLCPKNRTEPLEKLIITDRILQLAGVKAC
ncbi:hypothetical protein PTNB73_03784 [Pyrenophora teres f. teres]|nr:hypothetical protein HRS9122_10358 [Pyrenophora teres f. teres]KAE8835819.1 hypothetical protein HRS9139_03917 [Pyrenophora teres f. teres]KAE8838208.1 hypothetical protein PTNB85_05543 [Pyrenophora teres f. teres]KAE8863036.1 hypothetical protein PTNB29_05598 [Pyrenophora teres f. teres]KAE8868731.1 hypothetical protein PTNB73_03784 [Pyrenophora teres f. teres]